MHHPRPLTLLALAALTAPFTHAADTPAPAASVSAKPAETATAIPAEGLPTVWLQGEPVKAYETGKLYIFECWATWCGPCLQAMPHMESLHQKFKDRKDVQIVGINVFDTVAAEKLLPFLKTRGVSVTYSMAADGKDGPVSRLWLKPLGVTGIPFAMAVRDGKMVWKGHPAGLEEALIEAMAKPDYSAEKAPLTRENRREAMRPTLRSARIAGARGDMKAVKEILLKAAAAEPDESLVLPAFSEAFAGCVSKERDADALSVLRLMTETYPDSRTALLNAGNMAIHSEEMSRKDAEFALACAEKVIAGNAKDVAALELKAAALFAKGDKAAAIATQEEALKNTKLSAEIEALKASMAADKPAAAK